MRAGLRRSRTTGSVRACASTSARSFRAACEERKRGRGEGGERVGELRRYDENAARTPQNEAPRA